MGRGSTGPVDGRGPPDGGPRARSRVALWVPALYATFAVPWIAYSDALLASISPDIQGMAWWSTAKGIVFVLVTTAGLHLALRWALRREQRAVRRYDLLAEHARDVILFVRPEDGRILEANAAATATYGWSRDELRRLTVYDLRASAARAGTSADLSAAAAGPVRFETEHRRWDGTVIPVEVSSQTAQLDGERVLVSVIRDATERRRTEEALRESEERLALALDAAGLGTFHATPYGQLDWSERCCEIFGIGAGSIPDFEAFLALVHPDDRELVRAGAGSWVDPAGNGRYQQQYRTVRPDGTVRWVSAHGMCRFGEVDGVRRPVKLVGTLVDVTEVKAVQAQLMQSDRLASVGMVAAGVAHEINNPLAYLSAALDYLGEHRDELGAPALREEVLRALAEARDGADRVRHVVRDLRTFSGLREERRTRLELAPILEAAIHLAANQLRYRARVVRDFRPAPAVMADEARLGQVVLNLLINAAQAIPEGNADANEIRVSTATDESGRAVVEVHDTGAGIPPEIADRIFDPFFTTKPHGVGTGLGLSICRNIVLALGGEIGVESSRGGGTTLRVTLPAAPAAQPAAAAAAPPPRGCGRRGRVLVVDDEPAVAAAIRRLLAPQHDVVVRASAREAVDAIGRGERFDAILCDLMMPGMTGMDLHEALAAVAPEQAGRMVVLTGGAVTERAREFLARVPLPRCEKPFDTQRLRETVRKVVG
jgi:PAS domain S-box-containing protein